MPVLFQIDTDEDGDDDVVVSGNIIGGSKVLVNQGGRAFASHPVPDETRNEYDSMQRRVRTIYAGSDGPAGPATAPATKVEYDNAE